MGWLRSAGTAVASRGTCAVKKRRARMMLGENQPGRGPGSLTSARSSSHSRVLQFAVTARLLLLSGSLQLPSQGSFLISSRTSSLVQRGRPGSGEEKGAWLRCSQLGAQCCKRRGGRPPSQAHRAAASLQHSTQQLRAQGRLSRLPMCPCTRPLCPPLAQTVHSHRGATSAPVAPGRDRGHPRVLAQKKPSVTHLWVALGTRRLPPGPAPLAHTALLLSRSETRVQAWTGHSLLKNKTDITGETQQGLCGCTHSLSTRSQSWLCKTPSPAGAASVPAHGELRLQQGPAGSAYGGA